MKLHNRLLRFTGVHWVTPEITPLVIQTLGTVATYLIPKHWSKAYHFVMKHDKVPSLIIPVHHFHIQHVTSPTSFNMQP